jgi:hypothetical protein
VIPLVIGGLISAPFAGYLVKIAPAVDGDGRKPDPALERADVPEDGRVALTHRCPWTRRLIFPPRCRHDCRERRGSSEMLAIAGAVLTSAGRDSDLVVFTSGIGGGIKDLAPAKEFINLLMSSAALPPCYLVRCLYLGTSRTSADLRLESAKWAKADLIRSLSPIAI